MLIYGGRIRHARRYDRAVLLAVWVALGIFVLAVVGAGVSAGRAALTALREVRRFRGSASTELADLTARLERMSERAAQTPARRGDLERVPVTVDGRLVGVLSRSALQRRLAEDEPPAEEDAEGSAV